MGSTVVANPDPWEMVEALREMNRQLASVNPHNIQRLAAIEADLAAAQKPDAYLITWRNGNKIVSFDPCHSDDGTYAPLYPHPDPRLAKYRELLADLLLEAESYGSNITLPRDIDERIRAALGKP